MERHLRLLLESQKAMGDRVAFFRGGEDGNVFTGTAKLASDPSSPSREVKRYVVDMPDKMVKEVRLEEVRLFDKPKPIADLVDKLSFIKKKERWQAYFQGGLVQISEQDYNVIASS